MSLFLAILFSISQMVLAEPAGRGRMKIEDLEKSGQLVSVRIAFGEPIRIFVVGREEAKLNLDEMTLTVRRLKPYPGKLISISRGQEAYLVADPDELRKATDLEVTTTINHKSETLHFNINNRKP